MDFRVKGDDRTMHVLNAVPAAFSRAIVQGYANRGELIAASTGV